jgi:hypothetical protein
LSIVASRRPQDRRLLGALDPLGHGIQPQPPGEPDDGADDFHAAPLGQHLDDEGAVDLDLVDVEWCRYPRLE